MTTPEHLQRIKSKCEQLLELASKRTPGNFSKTTTQYQQPGYPYAVIRYATGDNKWNDVISAHVRSEGDAAFIASCAGPAEAGWRATIAAIDHILSGWMDHATGVDTLSEKIIAAWPEELL